MAKTPGALAEPPQIQPENPAPVLQTHAAGDVCPPEKISSAVEGPHAQEVADTARSTEEARKAAAAVQDSTIRVNVTLLDRLMNLVGELVLARNQIMQYAGQQEESAFLGTIQQLNLVTSELREGVMKTRMRPISRLFDKVPRVWRW